MPELDYDQEQGSGQDQSSSALGYLLRTGKIMPKASVGSRIMSNVRALGGPDASGQADQPTVPGPAPVQVSRLVRESQNPNSGEVPTQAPPNSDMLKWAENRILPIAPKPKPPVNMGTQINRPSLVPKPSPAVAIPATGLPPIAQSPSVGNPPVLNPGSSAVPSLPSKAAGPLATEPGKPFLRGLAPNTPQPKVLAPIGETGAVAAPPQPRGFALPFSLPPISGDTAPSEVNPLAETQTEKDLQEHLRQVQGTNIDPRAKENRMGIGQRIMGTLANALNGAARNGQPVIHVGPGATSSRYAQSVAARQADIDRANTQIASLHDELSHATGARKDEIQQQLADIKESLAASKNVHDTAYASGVQNRGNAIDKNSIVEDPNNPGKFFGYALDDPEHKNPLPVTPAARQKPLSPKPLPKNDVELVSAYNMATDPAEKERLGAAIQDRQKMWNNMHPGKGGKGRGGAFNMNGLTANEGRMFNAEAHARGAAPSDIALIERRGEAQLKLTPLSGQKTVRDEIQKNISAAYVAQRDVLAGIIAARPQGAQPRTTTTARQGSPSPNNKGPLSESEARDYLQKANGDKVKARSMAKTDGRTF